MQGAAKETTSATDAARENASTTTTTIEGDGRNQPAATCATKGSPNDHTDRKDL